VWLNEIVRYRRKEILDRLQHSFGKEFVARISFRVGEASASSCDRYFALTRRRAR